LVFVTFSNLRNLFLYLLKYFFMKKATFLIAYLLFSLTCFSQVVINEIDADTPSSDILEFIELKSNTPNFSLDGYVLVFFNGLSLNKKYRA